MSRPFVIAVLLVAAIVVGLRVFVLDVSTVASASMAPTICAGDLIVASRTGAGTELADGDIVVFASPADGAKTVKRVVAQAGESVAIDNANLLVNGQPVAEPWVDKSRIPGLYFGPETVPAGSVFVLGDDRELSIDSRAYGPVAADAITGKLLISLPSGC